MFRRLLLMTSYRWHRYTHVVLLLLTGALLIMLTNVPVRESVQQMHEIAPAFKQKFFPREPWPTEPVRHFVYHALHKTGSEFTVNNIKEFCSRERLSCLVEKPFCKIPDEKRNRTQSGSKGTQVTKKSRERYLLSECDDDMQKYGYRLERDYHKGEFIVSAEPSMVTHVSYCCPFYGKLIENGIDGVVDHMPLNIKANRDFIRQITRYDVFRFTIVRDPVQQFVSWYNQLNNSAYHDEIVLPELTKAIEYFYDVHKAKGQTHVIPDIYVPAYHKLTNSQSKELGWSGGCGKDGRTINETLDYLESLDFVGVTKQLVDSWKILRKMLAWPQDIFTVNYHNARPPYAVNQPLEWKDKSSEAVKHLGDPALLYKIHQFQWADIELYERAKLLFKKFKARYDRRLIETGDLE